MIEDGRDRSRQRGRVVSILLLALAVTRWVVAASRSYLNPDEAWKFTVASLPTWTDSLDKASELLHPPMLTIWLRSSLLVHDSELWMRLPSIAFAAAAIGFVYAWLRRAAGTAAALAALAILVSSPSMASAATEVREYGGLLFFSAAALYANQRFVAAPSHRWLVAASLALAGGFLTHHATAWVAIVLGAFVPLALRERGQVGRWWRPWAMAQSLLVLLAAWTVFGYGDEYIVGAGASAADVAWVQAGFPRPQETLLDFVGDRLLSVWQRSVGGSIAGALGIPLFVFGVLWFSWWSSRRGTTVAGGRSFVVLIVAPLALGVAVGWLRIYPFGALRQTDFVLPFLAAGMGLGIAAAVRGRTAPAAVIALAIAIVGTLTSTPANDPAVMPRADMHAALRYVEENVPPEAPLFTDNQTRFLLHYYWRERGVARVAGEPNTWRFGTRTVVAPRRAWKLRLDNYQPTVRRPARRHGAVAARPWILTAGWGPVPGLGTTLPAAQRLSSRRFGTIDVMQVRRFPPRNPGAVHRP